MRVLILEQFSELEKLLNFKMLVLILIHINAFCVARTKVHTATIKNMQFKHVQCILLFVLLAFCGYYAIYA